MLREVGEEVKPKEGSWYYKKHSSHEGFVAPTSTGDGVGGTGDAGGGEATSESVAESSGPAKTMAQMEEDVRKVREILEELKANGGTVVS